MTRTGGKVAILGGGMAGLSAAWRLSEAGWRDRFDSITVYQRGWRLGGKAASSRGPHGRIEEHGLHIWLGSYENAFGLLRECYAELDRAATDPAAPIQTWDQALIPADNLGLADRWGDEWLTWLGTFTRNDELPGDPHSLGREITAVGFLRRAAQLLVDFTRSLRDAEPVGLILSTSQHPPAIETVQRAALAALAAAAEPDSSRPLLDAAVAAIGRSLDYEHRPDHRRSWLLVSLVVAVVRGLVADNLVTDPRGFRAINDEDFGQWILRHGAHPDVLEFPLIRGLYDLVFGYAEGDPRRPAFAAGLAVFLTGLVLFEYKGAIFWKMTAGMGDVVIAPIYQVLRRRGVRFEFFHRVDSLHLDVERRRVETIRLGRQLALAEGIDEYQPLIRVGGLPVFPSEPLTDQVQCRPGMHTLETHFGDRCDVETRMLQRGADFDHVVLAVSLGMVDIVAAELIEDQPEWRALTDHVRTVATQAFQIWLRPDEPALGWPRPGVTASAYMPPFDTWASMPQTLWAEDWPADDRPGTVAYFCGAFDSPWPAAEPYDDYMRRSRDAVHAAAVRYLDHHFGLFLPGATTSDGFAWHLLCGADGRRGRDALATQHVSVNIDPSDRYVQSVPGSDKYRLRPDEGGYDNLVLAGDWTDCGMNAGCIEAAVMSGLQAANALLGRGRFYRIRGFYLP
ncbi:amine oxidase [Mycolicibacterium celeriflavum]|uniref:FAD-dependent oxidoreductase n=1 Tax=Mycolicibacterium celeriflavum TaxID=1249101 RepID=UPI0008022262|nr:FAD-dependent oxidoreductase [Mycolicibacterium celeriflavum]OBG23504.1 amine oxidase [Mycolicibacterium celeriflavum]